MATKEFGNVKKSERLSTEAVISSSYFDNVNDADVIMLEDEREQDFQE